MTANDIPLGDAATILGFGSKITTPLALGGFIAAILFLLIRQILQKNIFPKLQQKMGETILTLVINRLFTFAMVALVLGFVFAVIPLVRPITPPSPSPGPDWGEKERQAAAKLLEVMDARDAGKLYESFGPTIRNMTPFPQFKKQYTATMFQFAKPPEHRAFEKADLIAGQLYFHYKADYGGPDPVREMIAFVKSSNGWELYGANLWFWSFPLTSNMDWFTDTPVTVFSHPNQNHYKGKWLTGAWQAKVRTVSPSSGGDVCDFIASEVTTGKIIEFRRALGGCRVVPGQQLIIGGLVEGLDPSKVILVHGRFFPEPEAS
jgi:hypothetical protein